jgi:hypothetical protein
MNKNPCKLNDQAFFDINIDSEIEENTENFTPSSQPNLDLNNNNNNDRYQSLDRKSIFKFSKNSPKLSSQINDPLETPSPNGFLTLESKRQNGLILTPTKVTTTTPANTTTTNSKQQLNLQTALKKFSPINKTPPPNNLTISQAADLLLNEIGMACYSDDDEDDDGDDEEDEDIDLDGTKKTLGSNKVNSHCKKNLNQSESMNSFDNFLNSSTISSVGNNLLENNLADISVVKREEEESEGQNDESLFEEDKCVIDSNKTLLNLDDSNDFNNKTPIETDNDEASKTIDENKCKINENKTHNTITKQNLVKSQSLGYR